jgi:uncharacterized MnhB-related membrane protein
MKNWLWDKKFIIMAWFKRDEMRYAWNKFKNNDFVMFSLLFSICMIYLGVWAALGVFAWYILGSEAVGITVGTLGAILGIFIMIFMYHYGKAKQLKKDGNRLSNYFD